MPLSSGFKPERIWPESLTPGDSRFVPQQSRSFTSAGFSGQRARVPVNREASASAVDGWAVMVSEILLALEAGRSTS
jgi:hypothetical protein